MKCIHIQHGHFIVVYVNGNCIAFNRIDTLYDNGFSFLFPEDCNHWLIRDMTQGKVSFYMLNVNSLSIHIWISCLIPIPDWMKSVLNWMKLVWLKNAILYILLSIGMVPEPPCQMAQDDAAETRTPLLATASPLLPWSQSAQLAHYLSASASSFPDNHQCHGRRQCHANFSERHITALQWHHAVRTGTKLSSGKVRWLVVMTLEMAWRTRPLQLVLSGGPVTPTPIREYSGLRGENMGPFKGQQASASNPVMVECMGHRNRILNCHVFSCCNLLFDA